MSNTVQKTTNYSEFKFLGANREVNRGHVESLKQAFEEVGNLTQVQPILVNENMSVIDGQHRFTACQELGLPIYYTVLDGLGINTARSMNLLHRSWTVADYAKSYADAGNPNYQAYLRLKEDYGFSHSVLLRYIYNTENKAILKEFRQGELVVSDEPATRERLDKLAEANAYTNLARDKAFAMAFLSITNSPLYNQAHMLSKLENYGELFLHQYVTIDDNRRQLEELYNYHQSAATRVRLF